MNIVNSYFFFVWTPYFYATYERSSLQWLMRAHKQDGNYYMYMEGTCFWFLVKFLVSIWTQKQTNLLISANRNLFRQTFSKDNWQKITPVLRFGEKRNALKYNNVNFFTNFTLRWGSLRNRIILIRQNSLFKGTTLNSVALWLGNEFANIFHCNQEIVSVKFIRRKSIFSVKHWVLVQ